MEGKRQANFLILMLSCLCHRASAFAIRNGQNHQRFLSSAVHRTLLMSTPDVPFRSVDHSALSKSRAPFSMPRNSQDDSVPQGKGGELAWTQLGLLTELVEGVHNEMQLVAPTPVQNMVIPKLLMEPPVSLAFLAATGSGKTLAYVLPLLQMCKSQEMFTDIERRPKRPRIIILAPTRELALQITSVIKILCHNIKLSAQAVVGGEDYGKQRKGLDRYLDIVVATPGRLLKHWKEGHVYLGDVQHVVLDEMDTMLEQGFQVDLASLLHPLLYQNPNPTTETPLVDSAPRIILTSATMTQAVQRLVGQKSDSDVSAKKHFTKDSNTGATTPKIVVPQMQIITAPGLHRAVPRLKQVFVDVGNIDKLSLLVDVVAGGGGSGSAVRLQHLTENALTLVFCNTVASCRAAQHALAEAGLDTLCYHGELNSLARSENLQRFRKAGSSEDEPRILVCTDLAARGLDVPEVDHVVMFDFPLNALDYLHRSGRTARGVTADRAGNGRVTALVAKRDRVLAMGIESAVQRGLPLDGLSSRKSDYLPGSRMEKPTSASSSSRISSRTPNRRTTVRGGDARDKPTSMLSRTRGGPRSREASPSTSSRTRGGPKARETTPTTSMSSRATSPRGPKREPKETEKFKSSRTIPKREPWDRKETMPSRSERRSTGGESREKRTSSRTSSGGPKRRPTSSSAGGKRAPARSSKGKRR